jgi:hypothetical protein
MCVYESTVDLSLSGQRNSALKTSAVDFHEEHRLTALYSYDVLDTEPEKDFDDIAKIAARICGTPIAVVNLIGDRLQFLKPKWGWV